MTHATLKLWAGVGALLGAVTAATYAALTRTTSPVETLPVTSPYGQRGLSDMHKGVDVAVPIGTPVRAPFAGRVGLWRSDRAGFALTVVSPDGVAVVFMHLNAYAVADNATVDQGDLVALSGDTGLRADGSALKAHLHIEVLQQGKHVDPVMAFPEWPWSGVAS